MQIYFTFSIWKKYALLNICVLFFPYLDAIDVALACLDDHCPHPIQCIFYNVFCVSTHTKLLIYIFYNFLYISTHKTCCMRVKRTVAPIWNDFLHYRNVKMTTGHSRWQQRTIWKIDRKVWLDSYKKCIHLGHILEQYDWMDRYVNN